MSKNLKKIIKEELNKSDIKTGVKNYVDSSEFKSKIEKIVNQRLKDSPELEDKIVDITKNVLIQLYKTLWIKRTFWINNIKNSSV